MTPRLSKKQFSGVSVEGVRKRRRYTEEFKFEAVRMVLDGHTANSVCERLGLSSVSRLQRLAVCRFAIVSMW